jgi:iron complex transport system substrate-binding protein
VSRPLAIGLLLALVASTGPVAAEAPKRVVSMNVCTDQMAMLVAAPGQLHSVSFLAGDEGSSALADRAGDYAVNHGLAEEVFLMQPDLVLAGTYTTRATVDLLRRLDIRVEEFAPEQDFDDVRANLRRMGDLLEQPERAEAVVADLDGRLAEIAARPATGRTVATYYANSYTSGTGTLVDAVIAASGLTNLAAELGLAGTARLPLELLLLARPDLVADGEARQPTPALAAQNFAHPAYRALVADRASVVVPPAQTVCGTPFTAEAARLLRDAAGSLSGLAVR